MSTQAVASIEAGRRQGADAGDGHPQCRPDRDGRRPAGRALLRDEADPAGGAARMRRATSSRPTSRSASRWNELSTSDPGGRARLLRRAVRLGQRRLHGYGRDGRIPLHRPPRDDASARCAERCRASSRTGAIISACRRSPRPRRPPKRRAAPSHMGPHQVPDRRPHRHRHRPAGRRVRARRRRNKEEST